MGVVTLTVAMFTEVPKLEDVEVAVYVVRHGGRGPLNPMYAVFTWAIYPIM